MIISRKQALYATLFSILVPLLSWVKLSFIVGSGIGSFSIAHCLSPLIGMFGGAFGAMFVFGFRTFCKLFTATATTPLALACHIPTLCAALYLTALNNSNTSNLKKRLVSLLPLLCMILFWAHPIGSQAAPYALFWFIPVIVALIPNNRIALHALGSTFTAHAVGSVIWLYAGLVPTPAAWIALIPVVLCERLLFSIGMVISYRAIKAGEYVTPYIKQFVKRTITTLSNA